jgi:light-regulated signal transduction histidine kinase (bacteriophytochrome)
MLRSTSANCNKYYQNLGVHSKLVIALLHEGEPWGFASCLHPTAKHVSHEIRMACETIAHTVSLLLSDKEKAAGAQKNLKVRQNVEALISRLLDSPFRAETLADGLAECVPSGGAAAFIDGKLLLRGSTPTSAEVSELFAWLEKRYAGAPKQTFATRCLSSDFPAAASYRGLASGVLAVRQGDAGHLVWFRPEIDYEISWAGDPAKPVEIDERDGQLKVAPRKSFEMKRTPLKGISQPWQAYELESAAALSRSVESIMISTKLVSEARHLSVSKNELESFAHTAAHDLREPLRGIMNYSQMLSAELRENISETEYARLETIGRLAHRMDVLLQSLLECAITGQSTPVIETVDLNLLLGQAIDTVGHRISSSGATVRAASQLPMVRCDAVQVHQLLVNLIMNGLKYNNRPDKLVEVGFLDLNEPTFFVRDNGIGIDPKHHKDVFTIFRRLHGQDEYGGGSGTGLAIVSKIVENHGGNVWVESSPGEGSTFFFTLPASQAEWRVRAGMA